jgi:DNA-binding GntR family transcriptional regulator
MTNTAGLLDGLRDRIVRGELSPGAALRQEALAAELGVSRLPVRDALCQLEAEGLVETRSDRGAYVATLTAAQCAEVFDLRVLLECDALAHAIPLHTSRSLRAVQAVQAELEVEDDVSLWVAGDRCFHELLYAPGERQLTMQSIATLRNKVDRFYRSRLDPNARRKPWKAEHRQILQAVAECDINQACQSLEKHLRATERAVLKAVSETIPSTKKTRRKE